MKKIFYTLFVLLPLSLNAQWEIVNEGFKGWINTIDFVNENVGWIGGGWPGTLLKTNDGGENWITIQIDESWNISQIDFINESVGWAIGSKYVDPNWINYIWKSSNGGETWIQQFSSTDFGFNSVYITDETKVFAVGGNKIYKTTNGGTNWINVSPNQLERNYNSVWFQDSQTGVVVGNYNDGTADKGIILKTTNGGTNWDVTTVIEFNNIYDLQFLDNTNGYFRAILDTTHFICKTEDMFSSWIVKTQHPYSITSYQFLDYNLAYAIMGDSINANNLMKSIDGGVNWQNVQSFQIWLNKLYFINSSMGFLQSGYYLLKNSYGINNWEIILFRSYILSDVYFISENIGFLGATELGWHGSRWHQIFSTSNGGNSWKIITSEGHSFKSFSFLNNLVGFYITDIGIIYRSTNSGSGWSKVYENNSDSLGYEFYGNDMCFNNNEDGLVVGRYGDSLSSGAGILKTTDIGENWHLGWQFPDTSNYYYNFNSIYTTENSGWSVGDGGIIVKYTPQSGWIQQTSVTDLPLNKVFFSDDNHGWIAGGYQNENDFQKILLKTTNGGVNWNSVPNISYLFRDISFVDNDLGWAIGYNQSGEGGLLRTIDGGNNWVLINGGLPAKLNALYIKNNYGWAVGENGLILRNTDVTWVEYDHENIQSTEFVLEQNYPNPFNPSTVIRYRLTVISKVTMKVYDVLGREVATLVNEEQPGGNYEVEFNPASSIQHPASGAYFYRLTAGSYTSTKKMLLLK
jgi:photosystem II stability/assembly factor-like uncharacterized protein